MIINGITYTHEYRDVLVVEYDSFKHLLSKYYEWPKSLLC